MRSVKQARLAMAIKRAMPNRDSQRFDYNDFEDLCHFFAKALFIRLRHNLH